MADLHGEVEAIKTYLNHHRIAVYSIVAVLTIVIVSLIFTLRTVNTLKTTITVTPTPTSKQATVELKKEYENPFDKKTQYVNPFSQYKNPFDNIK